MPDRVVRDEVWQSERFLDLPTDAARLAFLRFISIVDDFGNFEGGARRLYRILQACTQVKNIEGSAAIIDSLMACDLIRRYEIEGRELFHVPRFKSHRQYLSRMYPPSPWCDLNIELGKSKRVINKGLARDVVTTSLPRSKHVAEGVEVEVGKFKSIVGKNPDDAREILSYLNATAGRSFEAVPANIDLIAARLKAGSSAEQCKLVIDARVEKWKFDPKMSQYLRPATIFNRTKFAQYVGELGSKIEKRMVI